MRVEEGRTRGGVMDREGGFTVAILVTSDRASRGQYEDLTGPTLRTFLRERSWEVLEVRVVPDDKEAISELLAAWCDAGVADLILTAGGTGLGPRDVTPEATRPLIEKELPGLPELLRARGFAKSPHAALSRAVAGARGTTLLLNLPGSPSGAVESLEAVLELLPHALEMLRGGGHGQPPAPASGEGRV